MKPVTALAALALALGLLLAGCGGGGGSQRWTSEKLVQAMQDKVQVSLSLDPGRTDDSSDVLSTEDNSLGYYSIFVFHDKETPQDYTIGDLQVPADGKVQWGRWHALDKQYLPHEGSYDVLATFGNAVLSYIVDAREGSGHPTQMPGGYRLLASVLNGSR